MPLQYLPDISSFLKEVRGDMLDTETKKHGPEQKESEADATKRFEECMEKLLLYRIVVDRYMDLIEEKERKTITMLKQLIDHSSPIITEIAEKIKKEIAGETGEFLPDRDVLLAIRSVLHSMSEIRKVKFPVTLWVTFEEIINYKIADEIDKAIMICSVFRCLGYDSLVAVSEDKETHVMIKSKESGEYLIILPDGTTKKGLKENLIKEYKLKYGFNDVDYEDYTEV